VDYRTAFEAITADARYLANLDWGKPRDGHPEGTIRAHIIEIEGNLESLRSRLSDDEYWKLKLLIHTHDTFKPEAQPGVRISSPYSHASLARAFLADHCPDSDLLAMVQHHDVPFSLYRQGQSSGTFDQERFESLLNTINDWNLFLAFSIIDGCTKGKSRDKLHWLFREVQGKVNSKFTEADIIT